LHDGSSVKLKKLEHDYDPTSRWRALQMLEEAQRDDCLVTGLIYLEENRPALTDMYNLVDTPLNRLTETEMRPARPTLDKINAMMF
jgi:2-oxoglutarate ferredoxin oxidoreductase subunit beta